MKALIFLLALCQLAFAAPPVATFSIVAYDPETKELGVAVASKFPAVGGVVPWARAGVGAIATQSAANTTYGSNGLALLAKGAEPREVLEILTRKDPGKPVRQVGIIDARGAAVSFTGKQCSAWAGGKVGMNFAAQGNILAGPEVIEAMAKAFEETEGLLSHRLLTALEAGQTAGGDKRGRQSAALLIVRKGWGYAGLNDRFRDVRVDDHATPITELKRVLAAHAKVFPHPKSRPPIQGE
jgi:uncharacterized Ntn-hydrolase superfamily protein